jgi:hypothetical protein
MAALLQRLGVDAEDGVDTEAVRATGRVPVLGGGVPVGEIRSTLPWGLDKLDQRCASSR